MSLRPKIPAEQAAALLADVIEQCPPFKSSDEGLQEIEIIWLARAGALLDRCGSAVEQFDFRTATKSLHTMHHSRSALLLPLHTTLAASELELPAAKQGAYIPAGDKWNGYASIVRLLSERVEAALIVDPYLDGSFFIDFVPLASSLRSIRCLTSDRYKASLEAASERWITDRRPEQPIAVRSADHKTLHDRLILFEGGEVFLVSQSFKDIGAKSAASVQRASNDIASSKVEFYEAQWQSAEEVLSYSP